MGPKMMTRIPPAIDGPWREAIITIPATTAAATAIQNSIWIRIGVIITSNRRKSPIAASELAAAPPSARESELIFDQRWNSSWRACEPAALSVPPRPYQQLRYLLQRIQKAG